MTGQVAARDATNGKASDDRQRQLIAKWIEPDPNRPGAFDARLREYFVHVWALIGHAKATGRSPAEVADAYGIPAEAAEAAFAYYAQQPEVIDAWIEANLA